jgi:predicted TIM-barrel fold metal-dependent hydrolase
MTTYQIVSSDSHVVEPGELWTERMTRKYGDRAPRMVREENADWLFADGVRLANLSCTAQTGVRFEEGENAALRDPIRENIRPGGYIPAAMIADMDADGVAGQVLYPSLGLALFRVPDGALLTAAFAAYNDWLAEFVKPFPTRLKGIAAINLDDVPAAVAELERAARLGLVGALITVAPPPGRAYDAPEYGPFWAAAQDLLMPVSFHIGTNRAGAPACDGSGAGRFGMAVTWDTWVRRAVADMIFGGVFEQFPQLRVGIVEHGGGWVPSWLAQMDRLYTEFGAMLGVPRFTDAALPSDFFRRNVFLSFQEDAEAIHQRAVIGVDTITFGSDYPHFEGTFPKTREVLAELLRDCAPHEQAKIAGGNAAWIYRFD